MRYYAHHRHKDFILCRGYRGYMIREYFLNYDDCMSNDFVISQGRQSSHAIALRHRGLARRFMAPRSSSETG